MKKPTGGSALIPSPRRGRTKVGVIGLIGSGAPLSRPFPIKGKGVQMRCNDMPPFSSSMAERKIVNHFVVTKSTRQCQILHTEAEQPEIIVSFFFSVQRCGKIQKS